MTTNHQIRTFNPLSDWPLSVPRLRPPAHYFLLKTVQYQLSLQYRHRVRSIRQVHQNFSSRGPLSYSEVKRPAAASPHPALAHENNFPRTHRAIYHVVRGDDGGYHGSFCPAVDNEHARARSHVVSSLAPRATDHQKQSHGRVSAPCRIHVPFGLCEACFRAKHRYLISTRLQLGTALMLINIPAGKVASAVQASLTRPHAPCTPGRLSSPLFSCPRPGPLQPHKCLAHEP